MPLFICSKCGCVDNSALAHAWTEWSKNLPPLCTECKTGTWHGEWEKSPASDYIKGGKTYRYVEDECDGAYPGRVEVEQVPETNTHAGQVFAKAQAKRERKMRKNASCKS